MDAYGRAARPVVATTCPRPETVQAWYVGEGDELPGGARVVSVVREPVRRRVRITTDAPQVAEVPHDHPVTVLRRAR